MGRPARPEREPAIARARALLSQGKTPEDVRADMRAQWPDVHASLIADWTRVAMEDAAKAHPGELEDGRRRQILETRERAKKLYKIAFRAISKDAEQRPDSVTQAQAQKGAYAAGRYLAAAQAADSEVAKLCHWYVIPPERDLESAEVRQLVSVMISSHAAAFEMSLLNEMIAALDSARQAKLDEAGNVVDLAARRAEMDRVL